MAHVIGNVIAFGSYGTFVSNGARALIEDNVYVMMGSRPAFGRAIWTTTTPGAMRTPSDVEGFIRLYNNKIVGPATLGENDPGTVPDPPYRRPLTFPAFAQASAPQAIACIASRAGRQGASEWPPSCLAKSSR